MTTRDVSSGDMEPTPHTDEQLEQMLDAARPGDHVVFMSNGGFDAVPSRFCKALQGDEHD